VIEILREKMQVVGFIVRRRSMGKYLAFADIQVEESDENDKETILKVAFRRTSPSWNIEDDDSFPQKTSALPYGAKVRLDLRNRQTDSGNSLEVHTWEILSNPRDAALEAAKEKDTEGVSCRVCLQVRADAYFRFNEAPSETDENHNNAPKVAPTRDELRPRSNTGPDGQNSHGDNRAKALRAKIFASWLIDTFGTEHLTQNGGVLDIAGGKGKLSVELALQGKIQSTIIDPLVRKRGKNLLPKEAKQIQKANAPHPHHLPKPFNQTTFLQDCGDLVRSSSICIGLHPDECTEDILDVALRYGKPVAIVPCCVFAGFFPIRTLRCGTAVRSCEQFMQYLLEKDDRLRIETLPFEGKNRVIYYKD
jgi:hypothetical protein